MLLVRFFSFFSQFATIVAYQFQVQMLAHHRRDFLNSHCGAVMLLKDKDPYGLQTATDQ
jgi:hypothetical protein